MRVRTEHRGRDRPFERERRIVLQRLPRGARISHAVITVSPYSTDTDRRFLEAITFGGAAGDWGATKTTDAGSLEVDLHARRKLAGLTGSDLTSRPLLVDLGGGFMAVNADGGLADGSAFVLGNSHQLPGLAVTGLRVPGTSTLEPDLSVLRVSSPPTNVSMAIEGGPVFWTFFGDLMTTQTTPDFAALLQAMLPDLDVVHGHLVVPLVVRSDSISRLDLEIEIDHTVAVSATPEGVPRVQTPYAYNGAPEASASQLSVRVPAGMVASAGGATGRAQGAFEATRVVHGSVTRVAAAEQPSVSAAGPLAQPLTLTGPVLATSVDLLLTAVTAQATVSLDVVDDLDGKPGSSSLLPRSPELSLTRDQAPDATWLNVALPTELELDGRRCWVVLHARDGVATWGADRSVAEDQPGLQQTRDGGLSWRTVPGVVATEPLEAHLRLRHSTPTFHMPLELRVGAGSSEVAVSLERFAAQGSVDVDLGAIGVAEAINTALSGAARPGATGEHVANGAFTDWLRVGSELASAGELVPNPVRYVVDGEEQVAHTTITRAVFSPDGGTVYAVGTVTKTLSEVDEVYAFAFEPLSRTELYARPIDLGEAGALVLDGPAGTGVVAVSGVGFGSSTGSAGRLVLFDTRTGERIGAPVETAESPVTMATSADASALLLMGDNDDEAVVRRIDWRDLTAAARTATELDPSTQASVGLAGTSRAIAVAPDGHVYGLTNQDSESRLFPLGADLSLPPGRRDGVLTVAEARDVAVTAAGDELLVLGEAELSVLRRSDLRAAPAVEVVDTGRRVAVDPVGSSALVLQDDALDVFDSRRRRMLERPKLTAFGRSEIAFSPAGTHVVLTSDSSTDAMLLRVGTSVPEEWELTLGQVRPAWLGATSGTLAVLGSVTATQSELGRGEVVYGPGALSQVAPAVGGQRYRFAFDGAAVGDGGVAELVWRGGDCAPSRTDRVGVGVLDLDQTRTLERLPHHEVTVTSPATAEQVEIRLRVTAGLMGVDSVSLSGSDEALSHPAGTPTNGTGPSWQPEPGVTVTPNGAGVMVRNGGAVPAVVRQVAEVSGGQLFDLVVTARCSEPAAVSIDFRDESATAVGMGVRLELDPLAFDQRAASGDVPETATEAEVRIVVPSAGTVEIGELSLVVGDAHDVQVGFVSEAPGELTVSGVSVALDRAQPSVPAVPTGGLCPPTPPAPDGGEQCYCTRCGKQRPVQRSVPVVTDAGRPGVVSRCPTCSTPRVRMGGPLRRVAQRPPVPRFRVATPVASSSSTRPAALAPIRVVASLVELSGVAEARAADLRAIGISSVLALADADVDAVAALPGVSERMARAFITEAARLVRERGVRVLFDVL